MCNIVFGVTRNVSVMFPSTVSMPVTDRQVDVIQKNFVVTFVAICLLFYTWFIVTDYSTLKMSFLKFVGGFLIMHSRVSVFRFNIVHARHTFVICIWIVIVKMLLLVYVIWLIYFLTRRNSGIKEIKLAFLLDYIPQLCILPGSYTLNVDYFCNCEMIWSSCIFFTLTKSY